MGNFISSYHDTPPNWSIFVVGVKGGYAMDETWKTKKKQNRYQIDELEYM